MMVWQDPIPIVIKSAVLPSYLECFEEDKVTLIYAKKPSVSSDNETGFQDIKTEIIDDESIIQPCDLTGNPLKVELGDNESFHISKFEVTSERWTADESKHFPLPVRTARRKLNTILKKGKSNCSSTTYIVCSADDSKKTVLLGGNCADFMACSGHVLGIIQLSDVEKEMNRMVEDHLRNCHSDQVKYLVNITYNLYGRSLRNMPCQNESMRHLSIHGNIYAEVLSPNKVFKISKIDEGSLKMHLEVVAGHQLLSLHFLWEELVKLQALVDILTDRLNACDETIICEEPLAEDVILQAIVELLSLKFLKRELEKDVVNLNNLREEDLLDGLWTVLSRCENALVLKNSFTFLFEQLAEGSIRIVPIKDDCSKVSKIIKGILEGKIGLSAVSIPESIELLFELGAQKLKFDFQVILNQFLPHIRITIDSFWKALYQSGVQEVRKARRTRATRLTNHLGVQNTISIINQLAYLSQLYLASEFIYFVKEKLYFGDEGFHHFCRCVEKEYISDRGHIVDFNELVQSPLNEMSFELDLRNALFLESVFPSRWTMLMETGRQTTIYDLSDSPIFPTVIYDYDYPLSDSENMHYYVTKMSRSTGLF